MLVIPEVIRIVRKPKAQAAAASPVLVAAVYDVGSSVTLTFDRPVNAAAFVAGELFVNDGVDRMRRMFATGEPTRIGPATLIVELAEHDDNVDDGVYLDAATANGIVAADGGLPWAGVADLALPFGDA